jgi:hypothetical protein
MEICTFTEWVQTGVPTAVPPQRAEAVNSIRREFMIRREANTQHYENFAITANTSLNQAPENDLFPQGYYE